MINLKADPGKLRALLMKELQEETDRVERAFKGKVAGLEAAIDKCRETHARFSGTNLPNLLHDAVVAYTQDLHVAPELPAGFSIKLTTVQVPPGDYRAYFLMYPLDKDEAPLPNEVPVDARLSKSVNDLELSVRTHNCLQNLGIRTIGDLVNHTEADLFQWKNFGKRSLNEIKEILTELGLSLRAM